MNLSSQQLHLIQNSLKETIKAELERPDCDYELVASYATITGEVDAKRREAWNEEKFGPYERVVEQLFPEIADHEFSPDDIPF